MDDLEDNWWMDLLKVKADKQRHQGTCGRRPDWWLEMGHSHLPVISPQDCVQRWMTLGKEERSVTVEAMNDNPKVSGPSMGEQSVGSGGNSSMANENVCVLRNTQTEAAAPFHIRYNAKMTAVKSAKRNFDRGHMKSIKNTTTIPC